MAMNVEVIVKGLALCYAKDNFWNLVFICDNQHEVLFKVDETSHPDHPKLRNQRDDRIVSFNIGTTPITTPANGANIAQVFNLASPEYAHGPGKLIVDPKPRTKRVHMKIPSATLDRLDLTERAYFVQDADINRPGNPPLIIPQVAKTIIVKFDVTDQQNGLKMIIEEGGVNPILFPYREGLLKLEFDNDCKGNCTKNDFTHYYDWVSDGNKKLHAGQVKRPVVGGFFAETVEEEAPQEKLFAISDQGNCDPIGSFPPPGPF